MERMFCLVFRAVETYVLDLVETTHAGDVISQRNCFGIGRYY